MSMVLSVIQDAINIIMTVRNYSSEVAQYLYIVTSSRMQTEVQELEFEITVSV